MTCSLGISDFLEEISSLYILLFSSISLHFHWGRLSYLSLLFFETLHSNGYIFLFLLCLSHLFFYQLFVRPPQTIILPFWISVSWGWSWSLPPIQCHKPLSIFFMQSVYQIKSLESLQAPRLSDLIPWIYLSLTLYNCKGFDLGHTWIISWFSLLSSLIGSQRVRHDWVIELNWASSLVCL